MNAIFRRTSVRAYTGQPVEEEKIEQLLRAGMAAPSGGNQQPWHFIVCTDSSIIEKLGQTSQYTRHSATAPLDIVLVADTRNLRFPEIMEQDMSACVENILLEAVELGLGACWQGVWPVQERMDYLSELFELDEAFAPFALVSIGYPASESTQKDRFDEARIHRNAW